MSQSFHTDWHPDPQLLAAYFDGELDGRAEDADVRTRIQAWLMTHPDAAEEAEGLKKLWLETTPAEPSTQVWKGVRDRIAAERRRPIETRPSYRRWLLAGAAAACAVLFVGILLGTMRNLPMFKANIGPVVIMPEMHEDLEVLAVAAAGDVTILRFEGDDTNAVVVGVMPVSGAMEWADPGEVCISCKCPRVNVRQDPPHRPMVWPRIETE